MSVFAETIIAAALKCRHCGEFLNTERAKAYMVDDPDDSNISEPVKPGQVLFTGQPTLWADDENIPERRSIINNSLVLVILPGTSKYSEFIYSRQA